MSEQIKLVAITQGAGELVNNTAQEVISYVARVSNPNNQLNFDTAAGLLRYCIKHKHWSVFETAYMTLEVNTTRGIAAQVLRHRSFTFQEFCLDGDSKITISKQDGSTQRIPIRDLYEKWNGKRIMARSYDPELNRFIDAPILSVYKSGEKPVYEYVIEHKGSRKIIKCTREHRVFTKERGFVPFGEAYSQNLTVALNGAVAEPIAETLPLEAKWGGFVSETYLGIRETYDIEMNHPTHNFVADGIVVHNSQRYADTKLLGERAVAPDLRRQDTKNRQNSIDDFGDYVKLEMQGRIQEYFDLGQKLYDNLLERGVARETARFILPLATPTRIYMTGSCRSWMHYISLREKSGTQKEHMDIARGCKVIFGQQFPDIYEALGGEADWEL